MMQIDLLINQYQHNSDDILNILYYHRQDVNNEKLADKAAELLKNFNQISFDIKLKLQEIANLKNRGTEPLYGQIKSSTNKNIQFQNQVEEIPEDVEEDEEHDYMSNMKHASYLARRRLYTEA